MTWFISECDGRTRLQVHKTERSRFFKKMSTQFLRSVMFLDCVCMCVCVRVIYVISSLSLSRKFPRLTLLSFFFPSLCCPSFILIPLPPQLYADSFLIHLPICGIWCPALYPHHASISSITAHPTAPVADGCLQSCTEGRVGVGC